MVTYHNEFHDEQIGHVSGYVNQVFWFFDISEDRVSDRGPQFTSQVGKAYCTHLDVNILKLIARVAFHNTVPPTRFTGAWIWHVLTMHRAVMLYFKDNRSHQPSRAPC